MLSSKFETKDECIKSTKKFCNELLNLIKKTYMINDNHLYISASIGVSLIDNTSLDASSFIKEADIAMYDAKSKGRDGIVFFNEELSMRIERKLEIERLLYFALQKQELTLEYQPQIGKDLRVIGCEVLIRWKNDKLGSVSPLEFIPVAEQTGLIIELGYYVLEEAFKTLKEWNDKGIKLNQMSINISTRQIFCLSFVSSVKTLLEKYLNDNLCSKIIFEITETSVVEDMQVLLDVMNSLKLCGIRFSMDDFGTGYSSLSHLRQIPIEELKIDRSFIGEIVDENQDDPIVKTILDIAHNLGLSIVAEGVETQIQKQFLLKSGCHILQGYYFSRPLQKEKFEEFATKELMVN